MSDTCRDCGARIQWLPSSTGSGKLVPYDILPLVHFRTCPAKRAKKAPEAAPGGTGGPRASGKGGNKGKKVPLSSVQAEAAEYLTSKQMGWKKREAEELVAGAEGEDVVSVVQSALAHAGAERR